jgi:hypothetical protein
MNALRWKELLAIGMIGEGVLAALFPVEHLNLWHVGPSPLRTAVHFCEQRPQCTRFLAVAEAGFGIWLARRQFDQNRQEIRTALDCRSRKGTRPNETIA